MAETGKDLVFKTLKELKIKDYNGITLADKKGKKYAITILVGKSIKWLDKEYQLTICVYNPKNDKFVNYFGAYNYKEEVNDVLSQGIHAISGQKLFRIDGSQIW